MIRRLLILLALSAPCFGQAWSGILSTSRAIDWTTGTGLPATITYGSGGSPCNNSLTNCVETPANAWTPPVRTLCSTLSVGASPATINAAVAACSPGSYVSAPAGTYAVNANLVLRTNGVTLRGAGANSTFFNVTASAVIQFGVCCGSSTGPISGTPASGTSTITLTGATGNPTVQQMADINQCDPGWSGTGLNGAETSCTTGSYSDPGSIWPCGKDYLICSNNNTPNGTHSYQHQMVRVISVSGGPCSSSCSVTIAPPLEMNNWGTTSNARMIWQSPSNESTGVGLEDMTVNFTVYEGSEQIHVQSAYAWWVKGVRIIGDGQNQRMDIGDHSVQGLFANNYIFAENPTNLFTASSEPLLRDTDTGTMLVNNIISGGLCLWGNGKMTGEVVAYNYCRDSQTPDNQALMLNHNPFEDLTLFEGNQAPQIHSDDTHGTNALITYFRNYSSGYDSPYITTHSRSYFLGDYNRMNNYIGNSLGGILTGTYSSTGGNDNGVEYVFQSDALTAASFMRWGNCDVVTATCRFQSSEVPNSTNMPAGTYPNATAFQNSTPANNNLPCSFFIPGSSFTTSPCAIKPSGGTGLSWWKVCTNWTTFPTSCASSTTQPFPPVGPDQSGGSYVNGTAYDNPAAIAYKFLPIDTSLQNSLTITASSWSNTASTCQIVGGAGGILTGVAPCEILTVSFSSIDNGSAEHIMGGFQLSGVAAGCIPAGINFATLYGNNEILMTGSTTGQVVYSLPSSSPDNGSSNQCTGTLLFPNIRKFDERVFQADSNPQASTPTFSPIAGTYSVSQSVTLNSVSAGAIICYNTTGAPATNGTTGCSAGTLYTTPVSVPSTETLFAVSGGTGYGDSAVGSALYTINASAPGSTRTAGTISTAGTIQK